MSLNPRQEKFAQLYVANGNATKSYIEAGYKSKDERAAEAASSRLLSNGKVSARVAELRAETEEKFEITRLDMLRFFYRIANDGDGEETRDQIAAAKEINRMLGYYEPERIEVGAESDVIDMLRTLTGAK